MRPLILAACIAAPGAVQAAPYSESMADCAALYQNSGQHVSQDKQDMFRYATDQWHAAAVAQSAKEGTPLTDEQMWERVNLQADKWAAKGAMFVFSQEFRDWSVYCKSFAIHTEVSFEKPES